MELVDIISSLNHLDYSQKKYHVDRLGEYAQLVFDRSHLEAWLDAMTALLGPPVKTDAQPVTEDIIRLTEDFGEIFDHQTLFYRELDRQRIVAMFWPWNRQDAVTLKIIILHQE